MKLDRFLSRVALSSIVAVIGGVALMNQPGDSPAPIVTWWLIYAVACGIALGVKPADTAGIVALMALLPAVIPVVEAVVLQFITGDSIPISGARITPGIGAAITAVCWFGIFLFSYARRGVLGWINGAKDPNTQVTLRTIESSVRAFAMLIGTVALLITGIGILSR